MRTLLSLGTLVVGLLGTSALVSTADASVIATASLYSPLPPSGATTTVVGVQSTTTPSQATYVGSGYTLSFSNVGLNEGIVQGASSGAYAIPVAGVTGNGGATYLTGDFGSPQTADAAASGNYLSTGTGTITLTFSTPQTSLALLWGSIDFGNKLTFNDAANDTLTGAQVQDLAAGFSENGFQGPTGSAYVTATTNTSFTTVTFTSDVISFEAAGIAGSTSGFVSTVPLPASAPLFGAALLALGTVGYGVKRKKAAAAV